LKRLAMKDRDIFDFLGVRNDGDAWSSGHEVGCSGSRSRSEAQRES